VKKPGCRPNTDMLCSRPPSCALYCATLTFVLGPSELHNRTMMKHTSLLVLSCAVCACVTEGVFDHVTVSVETGKCACVTEGVFDHVTVSMENVHVSRRVCLTM